MRLTHKEPKTYAKFPVTLITPPRRGRCERSTRCRRWRGRAVNPAWEPTGGRGIGRGTMACGGSWTSSRPLHITARLNRPHKSIMRWYDVRCSYPLMRSNLCRLLDALALTAAITSYYIQYVNLEHVMYMENVFEHTNDKLTSTPRL